jgi:HTH-type transcriptional regulator / antitoxin HipB
MRAASARDIGMIIGAARRHRGLTQSELARQLGVAQNWISEVENGKETAQIGKILSVLSFLGVRLEVEETWVKSGKGREPHRTQRNKEDSPLDKIIADLGNLSAGRRNARS